jgi:hypothetical protein
MSDETPVPQPKDSDSEWLRAFAEQYRNGTLRSVEGEYWRLIAIAALLEAPCHA